jgi:hypothetical protein
MGVEELSVTPGAIDHVRTVLSKLDPVVCETMVLRALQAPSLAAVRAVLAGQSS